MLSFLWDYFVSILHFFIGCVIQYVTYENIEGGGGREIGRGGEEEEENI